VSLLGAAGCGGPAERSTDGPLRIPHDHAAFVHYRPGQVFTDGLERLLLTGDRDAVLERVELEGAEDHIEFLGARLAGPHRTVGSIQLSDGYPPDNPAFGQTVDAEGARIGRSQVGHELLIGIKVTKAGYAIRDGVRLYYTVAGRKYTAYFPAAIVFCPDNVSEDACAERYESEAARAR